MSMVDGAGQNCSRSKKSLEAHLLEIRFFCSANRQMTSRTGAQVANRDTRAMMAAIGQDIFRFSRAPLTSPPRTYLGLAIYSSDSDLGQKTLRPRFGTESHET